MSRSASIWAAGILAGLAFLAHAMLQNSHAWPLLWAFLAGVLTVMLAGRAHHLLSAIGSGAAAGLIAGLIFLVGALVALYGLGRASPAAEQFLDIAVRELHPGRAAVIALAGMRRRLHFAKQRVHLGDREMAAGADRAVARHGRGDEV